MFLTDLHVTRTRIDPTREQRLADGDGLHLVILPTGKRYWRWDYTHAGRRKQLSFGKYPAVSLKRAREKKAEARALLDAGTDPSVARKRAKLAAVADTFRGVAAEWLVKDGHTLAPRTVAKKRAQLERYLLPALGGLPIAQITPPDVWPLLQAIERRNRIDTAHRVRQMASEIFRFAITTSRATIDPAGQLLGALKPVKTRHHPALIEPRQVGQLLTAIDHADAAPIVVGALQLAPLVFVRAGELRHAAWAEIDLEAALWRIPARRMKKNTGIDHLVPLSRQAVAILRDLKAITGDTPIVFPGLKHSSRPISDGTLGTVLRRLGYSREQQSVHGFRTIASTHLREIGFDSDLVELQLAHQIANPVRAAYDRAARVPERTRMMQAWADHLDGLKTGRVVDFVPVRARRA